LGFAKVGCLGYVLWENQWNKGMVQLDVQLLRKLIRRGELKRVSVLKIFFRLAF